MVAAPARLANAFLGHGAFRCANTTAWRWVESMAFHGDLRGGNKKLASEACHSRSLFLLARRIMYVCSLLRLQQRQRLIVAKIVFTTTNTSSNAQLRELPTVTCQSGGIVPSRGLSVLFQHCSLVSIAAVHHRRHCICCCHALKRRKPCNLATSSIVSG